MVAEERREQLARCRAEQRNDLNRRGVDDEQSEYPVLAECEEPPRHVVEPTEYRKLVDDQNHLADHQHQHRRDGVGGNRDFELGKHHRGRKRDYVERNEEKCGRRQDVKKFSFQQMQNAYLAVS